MATIPATVNGGLGSFDLTVWGIEPEPQTETVADPEVVTPGGQQALRETFGSGTHSTSGLTDGQALTDYQAGPSLETMKAIANQQIDRDLAQSPSGYIYGFEGLFAGRSGPVSPEELLLWLKGHSQEINSELRERMLNADMRNKLIKDLGTLSASVNTGVNPEAHEQARALLAAYEGTPYEAAAHEAVDLIAGDKDNEFGATEAGKMKEQIQAVVDKLGKDDQMDMIYIQQLANRLNEQFGFGSAYLSNLHNTSMSIIGNIA